MQAFQITSQKDFMNQLLTGELFEAGNVDELEEKIKKLMYTPEILKTYSMNCLDSKFETTKTYYEKLIKIYEEDRSNVK